MDFRELVKFRDIELINNKLTIDYREPFKIYYDTGFTIIISASGFDHCIPRETIDIYKYICLEVAFSNFVEKQRFICLFEHPDFKKFDELWHFELYCENMIYENVPVYLIQLLFDYVEGMYKRLDIKA